MRSALESLRCNSRRNRVTGDGVVCAGVIAIIPLSIATLLMKRASWYIPLLTCCTCSTCCHLPRCRNRGHRRILREQRSENWQNKYRRKNPLVYTKSIKETLINPSSVRPPPWSYLRAPGGPPCPRPRPRDTPWRSDPPCGGEVRAGRRTMMLLGNSVADTE